MDSKRILIAGVGNVFHGDDAFGVVAAERLLERPLPEGVVVADFGIRSYDLAFAMLNGFDVVILVDATARGHAPGTIYVLTPEIDAVEAGQSVAIGHTMNSEAVLRMLEAFGGFGGDVFVVGCEPATLESRDGRIGLSEVVAASMDEAIETVERLTNDLLSNRNPAKRLAHSPAKQISRNEA